LIGDGAGESGVGSLLSERRLMHRDDQQAQEYETRHLFPFK
jgi:hypothetical protein